jgi:hypothetical protein
MQDDNKDTIKKIKLNQKDPMQDDNKDIIIRNELKPEVSNAG